MQWFQFSLRRFMLLVLLFGAGLAFGKAALTPTAQTPQQIQLRFIYLVIAAASFGAAVGTVFRNIYNGFAIGVFAGFLFYFLFSGHFHWLK